MAEVREITNKPILLHGCCGLPLTKVRRYLPVIPAMARGQQVVAQYLNQGLKALAEVVENVVFIDEVAAIDAIGPARRTPASFHVCCTLCFIPATSAARSHRSTPGSRERT